MECHENKRQQYKVKYFDLGVLEKGSIQHHRQRHCDKCQKHRLQLIRKCLQKENNVYMGLLCSLSPSHWLLHSPNNSYSECNLASNADTEQSLGFLFVAQTTTGASFLPLGAARALLRTPRSVRLYRAQSCSWLPAHACPCLIMYSFCIKHLIVTPKFGMTGLPNSLKMRHL